MDVKTYIEMPESDKWWKKNEGFAEEVNDVPLYLNKTTTVKNSDFSELQTSIDKIVYEFMVKHDIPTAWHLDYGIDCLDLLKEYGPGCAGCDGYLTIFDKNKEAIICSI